MEITKNYLDICFHKNLSDRNIVIIVGASFLISLLASISTTIISDKISFIDGIVVFFILFIPIFLFVVIGSYKPTKKYKKIAEEIKNLKNTNK